MENYGTPGGVRRPPNPPETRGRRHPDPWKLGGEVESLHPINSPEVIFFLIEHLFFLNVVRKCPQKCKLFLFDRKSKIVSNSHRRGAWDMGQGQGVDRPYMVAKVRL